MADNETEAAFNAIVAQARGMSHLERIVGIIYDFNDPDEADLAADVYSNERATSQDIYFPSAFDALEAHEDFHVFLANFLEQQPNARVFIGVDITEYSQSRYLFDTFIVGKTRLCSSSALPSVDASLMTAIIDDEDDVELITDDFTVWEGVGTIIMQNLILEGLDVDAGVLTRMVLDGTSPLLRVLIATHPHVTVPILRGILEQADPTEFHLFSVILNSPVADDEVREIARTLGTDV